MSEFICGRFVDKYLIANRLNPLGLVISEELYKKLLSSKESIAPIWIVDFLKKIGYSSFKPKKLSEIISFRDSENELNFGKASYEITENCNYNCQHCYLGSRSKKRKEELSLSDKKEILKLIKKSGSFWLQITGGEPLISKDFDDLYHFAYSLGFLINLSTNGSLLTRKKVKNILSKYPPYRITISMYGATASSYEFLTQVPGSFESFCRGITWLYESKIRTRINILVTRYNEKEIKRMRDWAEELNFEHYIFSTLSPTLRGDGYPLQIMGNYCQEIGEDVGNKKNDNYVNLKCMAGRNFFHVNLIGQASICKGAREKVVDLLKNGAGGLLELPIIAEKLLQKPTMCLNCKFQNSCKTCPPQLVLYQKSGMIPSSVCKLLSINKEVIK